MKKVTQSIVLVSVIAALLLAACGPAKTPEPVTFKVAILPILDVLPMVVAQQEGLFTQKGVTVEFIPVGSAPERDQLIAAGQADAMVTELISTLFLNKDSIQAQVVRFARVATSDQALFRILAAKDSGISGPLDLKGVEVGVSQGTVIEYLTDRLLAAEGLSKEDIKVVAVPKIPDRLSLLGSGELKAAVLPEPFSTLAVQQGASLVLDDTGHPEFSYSVITFRKAALDEHPEGVKAFLAAIEEAVELINQDPQKYAALMVEQKLVPAPLAGTFQVPTYTLKGVPSEDQYNDQVKWAAEKGYLQKELPYNDVVNGSFLP